jgi:hypothetical protein
LVQSVNAVWHFFLLSVRLTVSDSTKSCIATIETERRRLRGYLAVAHKMESKKEGEPKAGMKIRYRKKKLCGTASE